MMSRGLIALAVAALAVVCLGTLTVTSRRTELLVGSYHVGGGPVAGKQGMPHQPAGYGKYIPCRAGGAWSPPGPTACRRV